MISKRLRFVLGESERGSPEEMGDREDDTVYSLSTITENRYQRLRKKATTERLTVQVIAECELLISRI